MPDVWPSVFDNLGESARDMLISSILPTRGRSRTWRGDEIALETSTEIPLLFRRYLQYSTVTLPKLPPYPPLFLFSLPPRFRSLERSSIHFFPPGSFTRFRFHFASPPSAAFITAAYNIRIIYHRDNSGKMCFINA